ncbi:MAG: hypothetical protein QOG86_1462, partial [Thermoleophilaceae bacterium]|nr:hypothetical protein [Thermoleophilaceae bacterium]
MASFVLGGHELALATGTGISGTTLPPLAGTESKAHLATDTQVGAVSAQTAGLHTSLARTSAVAATGAAHDARPVRALSGGRTPTRVTYVNVDGTQTKRTYLVSHFYKVGGAWKTVDDSIVADPAKPPPAAPALSGFAPPAALLAPRAVYSVTGNDWQAHFAPSDFAGGMVRITQGSDEIGFVPVGAASVDPAVSQDSTGQQVVRYDDVWPGVSLVYVVNGDSLKESIVLRTAAAQHEVAFRIIGATLRADPTRDPAAPAFHIDGRLGDTFAISKVALLLSRFGYVTDAQPVTQRYADGLLSISVDPTYLRKLPPAAFPASVDPSVYRSPFGSRAGGNYVSFKTDGYICYSNVCNLYAGSLYDQNWNLQWWRGAFFSPYDIFRDPNVIMGHANLHLTQRSNESFWTGTWDGHTFQLGHATCLNSFNCVDGVWSQAYFGGAGDIDATNLYQSMISGGDFGAWMMLMGEDGSDSSFKNFDPDNTFVDFTYTNKPDPAA